MYPTKTVNNDYLPNIAIENARQTLGSTQNFAAGTDAISDKLLRHLAPVISLP